MTLLGIIWFILVFLLIGVYFVLDGFDLGAGVLMPFVAKSDHDKALVRRSIGPVWDGNEVWLLTAGGGLFAAFPKAYATTFSGFYLAIMLVLFGLIVRAVAVEFASRDPKWSKLWNVLFFVGSLLPALLTGVAVGNIYAGIPMTINGDYSGTPLLGLVTPFTLLCGIMGLLMMLVQGAAWLAVKAPLNGELYKNVTAVRGPLLIVSLVVFIVLTLAALFGVQPAMATATAGLRYLFFALMLAALVYAILQGHSAHDLPAFIGGSVACIALVGLLAASMFPVLVHAVPGSAGVAITIANGAATDTSLAAMTVIACIGVPLVLAYHVIVYRTFRGRLDDNDVAY